MRTANRLSLAFLAVAVARTCVWTAMSVTAVVLPVLLFTTTGDARLTALLAATEVVPYLLVGLIAGAVADSSAARGLSLVCCVVCAASSATVATLGLVGVISVPVLFTAGLAAGIALVFFDAAMFAALPRLVPADALATAFSSMTATATIFTLIGPAAAGLALTRFAAPAVLLIDTALFVVALGIFTFLRVPALTTAPVRTPSPSAEVSPRWTRRTGTDIAAGVRFIARAPLIRSLVVLGVGNSFAEGVCVASLVPAVAVLTTDDQTGPLTGVAQATMALGAFVGSVVLPGLSARLMVWVITFGGLVAGAVSLAGWSLAPIAAVALAFLAVSRGASAVVVLNGITARARLTPLELQSRVNMTARMCAWGGQPLGAIAAAVTISALGPRTVVLVGSAVLTITAACAAVFLRRAESRVVPR